MTIKAKERRCLQQQKYGYLPSTYKEEDTDQNEDRKIPKTQHRQKKLLVFSLSGLKTPKHNRKKGWLRPSFTNDTNLEGYRCVASIIGGVLEIK